MFGDDDKMRVNQNCYCIKISIIFTSPWGTVKYKTTWVKNIKGLLKQMIIKRDY